MQIRQILRVSDQGVSRPYQCLDERGNMRWCKGNHTGLRSLMCEWVCGRIGRALGLPVPPCDILKLDVRMFDDWRKCKGVELPQLGPAGRKGAEELVAAGFDVLGDYGLSQGLVPEARTAKKNGTIFYDYAATCPQAHLKRWTEIRQASAPYIPGVSAGRDASPRCRLDEPFPWKTITYPYDGIVTNNTPEAFAQILKAARETTLADPKKPAAVLIYGWNEYTEGGYIAPTRLNGDGHLGAVEKVFGRNMANNP